MKTVVLSALTACVLAAGAALAVRSVYRAQEGAAARQSAAQRAALEEEVAALRKSRDAPEARLTALEAARPPAAANAPATKDPPGAAVAAAAEEGAGAETTAGAEKEPALASPEEKVEEAMAALLDPKLPWPE